MRPNNPRLRFAPLLAALAAPFGYLSGAQAAWEVIPELTATAETDDNVLLDTQDAQSGSRGIFQAGARLLNFGTRGELFVEPSVAIETYTGSENDELDNNAVFFSTGGNYRWRTVSANFLASYSDQTVLNAELTDVSPLDPDIEGPIDVGTGRIDFFQAERRYSFINGNLDFRVSDRNTLRLEMQKSDVAYSQPDSLSFNRGEFDTTGVGMQLIRQVDDLSQVSARMLVTNFTSGLSNNNTDSVLLEGRFSRPLTETWNLNLMMGVNRSDYSLLDPQQNRISSADTDFSFGILLRKRTDRSVWNVDARRSLFPSGNGFLLLRREVRAYLEQQMSPRLTGTFGVRLFSSETVGDINNLDDRQYLRFDMSFEWAMKRTLFLLFGVDSIAQEFVQDNTGSSVSNVLYFGITYRGLSQRDQRR